MSNSIVIFILLLLYSIFGACITITTKYLYSEKSNNIYFSHNWFLNILMFFAEMMELPLYYIISFIKNKKESKKDLELKDIVLDSSDNKPEETKQLSKTKKIILLGFPFIFDMISSNIGLFFLIMIPGNIYNMLKGVLLIIITFLISKFFLKDQHNLDQYISFIISIIGFIVRGLSTFLGEEENDDNEDDDDEIEMNVGLIIVSYLIIIFLCFFYLYNSVLKNII